MSGLPERPSTGRGAAGGTADRDEWRIPLSSGHPAAARRGPFFSSLLGAPRSLALLPATHGYHAARVANARLT
jgi:hypothetical protein